MVDQTDEEDYEGYERVIGAEVSEVAPRASLGVDVVIRPGEGGEIEELAPWPESGSEGGGLCPSAGEEGAGGSTGGGEIVGGGDCPVARHGRNQNPNPNSREEERMESSRERWW